MGGGVHHSSLLEFTVLSALWMVIASCCSSAGVYVLCQHQPRITGECGIGKYSREEYNQSIAFILGNGTSLHCLVDQAFHCGYRHVGRIPLRRWSRFGIAQLRGQRTEQILQL